MLMLAETPENVKWISRVEAMWREIQEEVMYRGFHGTASIEVQINDGTIHKVLRRVDRIERY